MRRIAVIENDDNTNANGGTFQRDILSAGVAYDLTSTYNPSGVNPLLPASYDPKSYQPLDDFEKKHNFMYKFKMPNQNPFFLIQGLAIWDNRNPVPYNAILAKMELDTALGGTHKYMAPVDTGLFELDISKSYAQPVLMRSTQQMGLPSE